MKKVGNTYKMPQHKWVLSKVQQYDGHNKDGIDTITKEYKYEDGYYDRHEREFYGFKRVITLDKNEKDDVYRKNIVEYINDNYYEKGLIKKEQITDAKDRVYVENLNVYESVTLDNLKDALTKEEKQQDDIVVFVKLVQTQRLFYEGLGHLGESTAQEFDYDEYGNVISQIDYGELRNYEDTYTSFVKYSKDLKNYIVSIPIKIEIYDENQNLLRDREAKIDNKGSIVQININTNKDVLTTDMSYDKYGNLKSIIYPPNQKEQRYKIEYTYDDKVHSYVTNIKDSFGYETMASYDYRFGIAISQSDINQQKITTKVDNKARVVSIIGPMQQDTQQATIEYEYHPEAKEPYAITRHYDSQRTDTIDTVTFVDGLKRVTQIKKDIALDENKDGKSIEAMSVSGHIEYDAFGRVVKKYHPISEIKGSDSVFNYDVDNIKPTEIIYDILDREIKTILPDGAILKTKYDFKEDQEGIKRFHKQSIDANLNVVEEFKDVRGRITSVLRHNPIGGYDNIWTSYKYNAVNELLEVKDSQNNKTISVYDKAGRRLSLQSPDMGLIEYVYDKASNLVKKITPNLKKENKAIEYVYDYNRVTNINYPNNGDNNVTYIYGNDASKLNVGRIVKIKDASGIQELSYGRLGEIIQEKRTINSMIASMMPQTYVTKYKYDTWNRLQEIIYPDKEIVIYKYDAGGKLCSMRGKKGDYDYDYLKMMTYDKFGQRVYVQYGNDVISQYEYEPTRRRVVNLMSKNKDRIFVHNQYQYDAMNNVKVIKNIAVAKGGLVPKLGGEITQQYQYDNLYQLIYAQGLWNPKGYHQERYKLQMKYDNIGNIIKKEQKVEHKAKEWIKDIKTSYTYEYQYNSIKPHAPTQIGKRVYSYDDNGNQIGWQNSQLKLLKRTIKWDEENRIKSIEGSNGISKYIYDANNQRVVKQAMGAETEVVYVNPYYVIRDTSITTKHYFAGSQRVATKLILQSIQISTQKVASKVGLDILKSKKTTEVSGTPDFIKESLIYYYHPDHLGSSNYITDDEGKVVEHLEYLPFGETFVHQQNKARYTPYRFTSKELDADTGLYYYGARYYDPRTSIWQSPDPILNDYFDGKVNGGVFSPVNLQLYSYTYNNPVNLVDPDGNNPIKAVTMAAKITYKIHKLKGKLTSSKFKKILKDEGMDIIDDIETFFDGQFDLNDVGALVDLVIGTNFNNKATKIAKKAHGNTLNDAPAELYKLVDRKTGKIKKIGETTHGERRYGRGKQRRYTEKYLDEQGHHI